MTRRETSVETLDQNGTLSRPFTPYEALMSAAPGEPIDYSQMELLALRDVINDAIEEVLTDLERWVFNALVVERQSLRELGRQLNRPKSTIARIRDRSAAKLALALEGHPTITHHLESQ